MGAGRISLLLPTIRLRTGQKTVVLKSLWLNHRLLRNKVNSRKIKLESPKEMAGW
jgi:hypothetical protein